jgi:outer membrane protein assembly factor BamB
MKTTATAITLTLLAVTAVQAQDPKRQYTQPAVPSREVLDRLNLKLGWRAYVPMDGRRDGIFTVQLAGDDLLVLTRSGLVVCLDTETGRARWRSRFGHPYRTGVGLGFNAQSVFMVSDQDLYAIDRANGQLQWDYELPDGPTATPVADDDQLFISLGEGKVHAFALPRMKKGGTGKPGPDKDKTPGGPKDDKKYDDKSKPADDKSMRPDSGALSSRGSLGGGLTSNTVLSSIGALTSGRQASKTNRSGLQPHLDWTDAPGLRIELTPVLTQDAVFIAGANGHITSLATGLNRFEHFERVLSDGAISVPPTHHGEEAYVGGRDGNLYAVKTLTGTTRWRFTMGTAVVVKPVATDEDVFVTSDRGGLHRVKRSNGEMIWRNGTAARFLAENKKFVYATDRAGRFLVLDRASGKQLSMYNLRDFVFPIANEHTDRVYLAANDGLVVCLHDKDYATPLVMKKETVKKPAKGGGKDKPGDKDKPKEKPGDKDKPKDKPGDQDKPKDKPGDQDKPKDKPGDMDKPGDKDKPKDDDAGKEK